jgi:hypothetical protein
MSFFIDGISLCQNGILDMEDCPYWLEIVYKLEEDKNGRIIEV